jgi:hypothetical protein
MNGFTHHRPGRRSLPLYIPNSICTVAWLGSTTKNPPSMTARITNSRQPTTMGIGEAVRAPATVHHASRIISSGNTTSINMPERLRAALSRIIVVLLSMLSE